MLNTVTTLSAANPRWPGWLTGVRHDFFHTAGHHRVWQESGAGEAAMSVYAVGDQAVLWPHLKRPISNSDGSYTGLSDITAVDGYCGPLCRNCEPGDAFTAAGIRAILDYWRETGVISVFARFHPLLSNERLLIPEQHCPGTGTHDVAQGLRHQGHTVSIDLQLSDEQARALYRENHLRDVRKAARKGIVVEPDNSPEAFNEFVRLYHQTMDRNGADAHYFFSHYFLRELMRDLGDGASIHVARLDGRILGAVLITECQGIVQYLLGGVAEEGQRYSPLKALIEGVRKWARARGNQSLHLGGGRGCNDSDPLHYFKAGFSDRRHCFYIGRSILNPVRYDALVSERRRVAVENGVEFGHTEYFPAYRAPFSKAVAPELVPSA